MTAIISFLGVSGSGKDTAGEVLAREMGGFCIAFADPMKRFCMSALGLTADQLWGNSKEKPILKTQLKVIEENFQFVLDGTPLADKLGAACNGVYVGHDRTERSLREWWSGIASEKKLTPRRVLQTFGTEFGRKYLSTGFWVQCGLRAAGAVLSGEHTYSNHYGLTKNDGGSIAKNVMVFTDCRFRNEVLALKKIGAKVYRIRRMAKVKRSDKLTIDVKHSSEAEQGGIPDFWLDGVLLNHDGEKEKFEKTVASLARHLMQSPPPGHLSI